MGSEGLGRRLRELSRFGFSARPHVVVEILAEQSLSFPPLAVKFHEKTAIKRPFPFRKEELRDLKAVKIILQSCTSVIDCFAPMQDV